MLTVSESFTDVGSGAALAVQHRKRFTYDVSGTFEGTVVLERSVNGGASWEAITSTTDVAASGVVMNETRDQAPAIYRWTCSVFTSGTIVTTLVEEAGLISEVKTKTGETVMTVKDDGIHTIGEAVDVPPLT